jgi:hypothetical protein
MNPQKSRFLGSLATYRDSTKQLAIQQNKHWMRKFLTGLDRMDEKINTNKNMGTLDHNNERAQTTSQNEHKNNDQMRAGCHQQDDLKQIPIAHLTNYYQFCPGRIFRKRIFRGVSFSVGA